MTKPVTIPNTFATATTAIPLSNLDADFSTVATAMNDANTYSNYAPDTGSANAYVVTLTGVSTLYSAGLRIQFKAGNANTTASTLNVNGQGAKNITYQDASAIASGTIAANAIVDVMYDGTQFLLMNDPAGATGGDVVGPAGATANAVVRFDSTTGKLVKNSVVTIADSTGDMSGVGAFTASGNVTLGDATTDTITLTGTVQPGVVISGSSSGDALRITQTGAGNALLVEDSTNPDSSPFVVDASGNVGIGTTSIANKLTISEAGNNAAPIKLIDSQASGHTWYLNNGFPVVGALSFYDGTASSTRLVLDGSGNLGLGVTPSAWLSGRKAFQFNSVGALWQQSNGFINLAYNTYEDGANTFKYILTDGAARFGVINGAFAWFNAPSGTAGNAITFTQAMTLDASGNLGVGTTNPSTRLSLSTTGAGAQTVMTLNNAQAVAANVGASIEFNGTSAGNGLAVITGAFSGAATTDGAYLSFSTRAVTTGTMTERARIDSSGNWLVGTTSQLNGTGATISTDGRTSSCTLGIQAHNAAGYNARIYLECPGLDTAYITYQRSTNRLFASVSTENSGPYVASNGTSWTTNSDRRLKTNIESINHGLASVMALAPKKYAYKNNEEKQCLGFIAQDVVDVIPEIVDAPEDANEMMGIDYQSIIPVLVKAIQEQQALITSLTARVALLEGN